MSHQVVNLNTHRKGMRRSLFPPLFAQEIAPPRSSHKHSSNKWAATVNLNTAHHKASMVAILHKARYACVASTHFPDMNTHNGPQMQYQQGPPQQIIVQKKDRGCLNAW